MTSTDEQSFLAAIYAAPDDDTPRLVFADWLQENGDEPRAEFIRIQCELERLYPGYGFPPEHEEHIVHAALGPAFRERYEREQVIQRQHSAK